MNVKEYNALFDEIIDLTVGKKSIFGLPEDQPRLKEIRNLIDKFQATNPTYHVVCVRDCYVGQGMSYSPGQVFEKTWDPGRAKEIVEMFDTDPWVGPGAWEIRVEEPNATIK